MKAHFMAAWRRFERNNNRRGRLTGTLWLADVTGSHCAATEGGLQDGVRARGAADTCCHSVNLTRAQTHGEAWLGLCRERAWTVEQSAASDLISTATLTAQESISRPLHVINAVSDLAKLMMLGATCFCCEVSGFTYITRSSLPWCFRWCHTT